MGIDITWLGHSGFVMNVAGHSVVIDPFLTGNPIATTEPTSLSPEVVLLSHAHGDHLGDTVDIAKANGATVVTNFEISEWMGKQGLENVVGINPGGTYDLGFMTVKATRAYHSSSFPDGSYGGVPMGFVITVKSEDLIIYFAGDTDLFSDMKLIAEAGLDLVMLPIGDHFTMGVDDSLRAITLLQPDFVMPMHYNTFPPITQDAGSWAERVNTETSATPVVLDPGGMYTLE
jgi:L-ascorbate metabolism protein UlaG (beta-lactamase superfamily)